ncbi:MAG: hypothetical protein QOH54_838 [Mycobacterium sp.]|jgi:hypothetical protein|nr:hypothetical protein [Mycobacterium sp.]
MSAAMLGVSSASDITTKSDGGSPSSNAMLRSKCDGLNFGLIGIVQSSPIFDVVPGAASSAIMGSTIVGSTVIVLQFGMVTASRCGMYRNAMAHCTALSSQMSTSSSKSIAIFGSPCFERVNMTPSACFESPAPRVLIFA